MSNLAIRLYPEALRSLAHGSISGTYAVLGTPLLNPSRIYFIVNETDVTVTCSWDGVVDHFVLVPGGFLLLDVTTNRTNNGGALNVSAGTQTWIKGSPTVNSVYLTSFYGLNG